MWRMREELEHNGYERVPSKPAHSRSDLLPWRLQPAPSLHPHPPLLQLLHANETGTQRASAGGRPAASDMSAAGNNDTSDTLQQFPRSDNRGPAVLAVSLWMIAWSTAFVVLRLVSRLYVVKKWSLDDTFIIIAWFLAFGFTFSILWGVRLGLGIHQEYVSPEDSLQLRKSEYVFSVLYNPVLMATKTSILCFYLTLSRNLQLFRWATLATLVVVNVCGLALTLLNVFQCRPIWTLFYQEIPPFAVCTDLVVIYLSSSPVNIVTDLAILVLPFPVLTNMRLPKKQKIILIITFSFGAFVAVVDVIRIAYLQEAFQVRLKEVGNENAATSKALEQDDFSWYASISFMWSAIEIHIGIICACVPSLKPLVARVLPSMLRDLSNPEDKSRVDSVMRTSNPLSSGGDKSAPVSPTSPTFSQRGGGIDHQLSLFAHLEAAITPDEQSPAASIHSKEKHDAEKGGSEKAENDEAGGSGESGESGGSDEKHDAEDSNEVARTQTRGTATTHDTAQTGATDEPAEASEPTMDFMEFLTTPGMETPMASPTRIHRHRTNMSSATTATTATSAAGGRRGSVPFFDFYSMKKKKPMTRLTNKQAFGPLAAVTILFFLWGFAYGLLDVLNSKFAQVNNLSTQQALGLHASYFCAYAFGPTTVGQITLIKLGFRATFIVGLAIYSVGTLIFWPAAVLSSYPAYVICNFINGFGVSILEVAANPFVALCGPPRHAESRLNISQGVQAIGTVVAPILAQKVLFKSVNSGGGLIDVQWAYLGIAFFDVGLAMVFYYLPLPEATDEDFERVAEKRESVNEARVFGQKVIYVTLALGVLSQFCYVGAQEAAAEAYQEYVSAVMPNSPLDPSSWQTMGHTMFAISRFITAALGIFIKPRHILLVLYLGMIITAAAEMTADGQGAIAAVTIYQLFQGGVFSLSFAITLRGLGSFTKRGSVLLTAAISGGAIFPVILEPVAMAHGIRYAMCVVVACAAFGTIFPVYLIATPQARKQVDPVLEKRTLPRSEDGPGLRPPKSWIQKLRPSSQPTTEHLENGSAEESHEPKGLQLEIPNGKKKAENGEA